MNPMNKAVILARGLGTRMRNQDDAAKLTAKQAQIAATGVKAMIPIEGGGTFLDYVLSGLADAGYSRICLVIGPEHTQTREYFGGRKTSRISIDFAIQEKPLGTADAVRSVEKFAGNDPFLVINSDNYYPRASLEGLRRIDTAGLAGFEKDGMLAGSNIPADRIAKFAVIGVDSAGYMTRIIEKPSPEVLTTLPEPLYVSMNCWRFDASIFEACANIKQSARGEFEIPDAVQYSIEKLGTKYKVVPVSAPVLDLSSRNDVEAVVSKLAGLEIKL